MNGKESKWRDRISSGFDKLVAFASTELDKRRRNSEGNDVNSSPESYLSNPEHSDRNSGYQGF